MQSNGNEYNPVFVSKGDHKVLMKELNTISPLSFARNRVWVMSLENLPFLQLRLDNNILFYDEAASGGFDVYESYSVKGSSPITSHLYKWHEGEDQRNYIKRSINLLEKRSNLNGVTLKEALTYNRNDSYTDLLLELQAQLNFTIERVEPKKRKPWGSKLKNGTWNGLVGMLVDKKIDLTAGLMINAVRANAVSYCWATSKTLVTLYSSKTTNTKINVMAYVTVFPLSVWVLGLAFLIIAMIFFALSSQETIGESIALMFNLLLQLGYDIIAKNVSSRIVLFVAAVFTMVFFIFYTGDMTAKMTSEPPKLSIRSFQDVTSEGYKVLTTGIGNMPYNLLRVAPQGSAMRRIFDRGDLVNPDDYAEMGRILQKESKVLLFAPDALLSRIGMLSDVIPLDIVDKVTFFKALAFQKESELTPFFNHHLRRMEENGATAIITLRREDKRDKDFGISEPIVLGYDNLLFPSGWLALGMVISGILVFGEKIVKKSARNLRQQ